MITVSAGGSNTSHPQTFYMSRPHGFNSYLLLLIKTRAVFDVADKTMNARPNSAIIIAPRTPHRYCNPHGPYVDDWLHFICTDPNKLQKQGLVVNELFPLANPDIIARYIQQIVWEKNYTDSAYRTENVAMLLHVLLNNLILAYRDKDSCQYNPYYSKLQNLRLSIRSDPGKKRTIRQTAKSLGISDSYFQHLYKHFFGIAFQTDLINMRLALAKDLLRSTNLTCEKVAEICGYLNDVHFYRQFRQKVGTTPGKFRKQSAVSLRF